MPPSPLPPRPNVSYRVLAAECTWLPGLRQTMTEISGEGKARRALVLGACPMLFSSRLHELGLDGEALAARNATLPSQLTVRESDF